MRTYNTISEIKEANKSLGHYYFEPDTMRFFKSKVYPEIVHGNLFITSEKYNEESPRLFSVRCALSDGSIESLSKFQAFNSKAAALRWARRLPECIQDAVDCVSKEFNTGKKNGMGFLANALIEPKNNKGKFSKSSFAGACTWLMINWNDTDLSYLKGIAKEFEEALQSSFNNVPTNKDATL